MILLVHLPFLRENRVDQLIPPSTFEISLFTKPSFKLHTQLLQHMCGTDIVGNAVRPNTMNAKTAESEIYHRVSSFGGITLIPMFGIQFVANVRLKVIHFIHADAAAPDELVSGFQD